MLALGGFTAHGDGIYRDGVGARSMALGGADVSWANDALGAMAVNPAGLGFQTSADLDFGLFGAFANGEFKKGTNSNGSLDSALQALPESGFALPLSKGPVTLGLAFVPDALMSGDWHYTDPPGGLGGNISYGYQDNKSTIALLRTAFGLGVSLSDQWSVGASVGVLYNQNALVTPYIFQSTPGLAGVKTLLNLKTTGWGVNGQFGAMYRPMDELQFGVAYTTKSTIDTHGSAFGDAGAQLSIPSFPFHYDVSVKNVFPQMASGGVSWKFLPDWRLALQLDWVDWAAAFRELPVILSDGNNGGLPGSMRDDIPLHWRSEFVYRGGVEYAATTNLTLRGGYSYGASPVPDDTLSPLTAAITEHTLTAGVGYQWSRYHVDLAYQWQIPIQRNVGTSGLLDGEYSNSSTTVGIQWLALTAGIRF